MGCVLPAPALACTSCSQSMGPTASAPLGNLLKMQVFLPHPRPSDSETLGVQPAICVLTSLPGHSDTQVWELLAYKQSSPCLETSSPFKKQKCTDLAPQILSFSFLQNFQVTCQPLAVPIFSPRVYKMRVRIWLRSCKNYTRWLVWGRSTLPWWGRRGGFQLYIPRRRHVEEIVSSFPHSLLHVEEENELMGESGRRNGACPAHVASWTSVVPFLKVKGETSTRKPSCREQSSVFGRCPVGIRIRHTFCK